MARYRTKPVEIEATEYLEPGDHPAVECNAASAFHGCINTRQGFVRVDPGDFIITLADGESYPCKPDVFHAKYEAL